MPELETVLESAMAARLRSLHTAFPAKVQRYNASARTADLVPMVTPAIPGSTDDDEDVDDPMPVLMGVPVLFQRANGCILTLPVQAGDTMLVVICERDIGRWRATGERDRPDVPALHALSGAVAIPGLYPTNATEPTFEVALTPTRMEVGGNTDAAALASRVDQLESAFLNHTHATTPAGPTTPPTLNPGFPIPLAGYASEKLKVGG